MIQISKKKSLIIGIIISLVSSIITSFIFDKTAYNTILENGGSISFGGIVLFYVPIMFVIFEIVNIIYIMVLS